MRQAMRCRRRAFDREARQSLVKMSPLPSHIDIIFVLSPGSLFWIPSASNENPHRRDGAGQKLWRTCESLVLIVTPRPGVKGSGCFDWMPTVWPPGQRVEQLAGPVVALDPGAECRRRRPRAVDRALAGPGAPVEAGRRLQVARRASRTGFCFVAAFGDVVLRHHDAVEPAQLDADAGAKSGVVGNLEL